MNRTQPTGVVGLDAHLEGGYPSDSVIIVIGTSLSGIDHIARQFWNVEEKGGSYLMIDGELEEGMVEARELTRIPSPPTTKGVALSLIPSHRLS